MIDSLERACQRLLGEDAWADLSDVDREMWKARFDDALGAYEDAEALNRRCEEPGCENEATCGTPTPDGYKRLCGTHFAKHGPEHKQASPHAQRNEHG